MASPTPAQEAATVREDKKNQIIQLLKSKTLSSRDGAFGFSQYPYQLFISELKEKLNINPEEGYALFMELVDEKKIKAMFVRTRPTYIFGVT
ncbi:MAG: hypothetical protein ACE5PO_06455 [Candidatus Bathyarchaeia archaeon]